MEDINKDIEILENLIRHIRFNEPLHYGISLYIEALEHLIKAYKELEIKLDDKETELQILKDDIKADEIMYKDELLENYIPISLIKETIEELDKEEQELQNSISDEKREEYSDANISFELMDIEIRRSVLQELLERK